MSVFDFPRINFKGTLQVNPGTANNDDYAGALFSPDNWGPFSGATLGLLDSKRVEARMYGMPDDAYVEWVQKPQPFVTASGATQNQFPAEWNYYGDMGMKYKAEIVGVQGEAGSSYEAELGGLVGLGFQFSGVMTDINPEGSPPATQFFLGKVQLVQDGKTLLSGTPSKGAGQWINFYRNVNIAGDGGAGSYFYHVIEDANLAIPGFDKPGVCGVVLRYYVFRAMLDNPKTDLEELYKNKGTNTKTLEMVGTIAPLYQSETIRSGPTGRLLVCDSPNIVTPQGSQNNGAASPLGNLVALGPAVARQNGNMLSVDFAGTFPDNYQSGVNDKYDFGAVSLRISGGGDWAEIGAVDYADTAAGNRRGWVFDFDLAGNSKALELLKQDDAQVLLVQERPEGVVNLLAETDYFFVSNQLAVYAEQFGSGMELVNQGTAEAATVAVFRRGVELTGDNAPAITTWQYRSTPMQSPGDAEVVSTSAMPGEPIAVDTSQPGNILLTFSISNGNAPAPAGYPPKSYATFMFPPYVTNSPQISVRILPNDEDFSQYYVDPKAAKPVGNERLTFEVVYEKSLRTYYLLYPAMNQYIQLNSEAAVRAGAGAILSRTGRSAANWMSLGYMPPTRDMSVSRSELLQAWCRKVAGS